MSYENLGQVLLWYSTYLYLGIIGTIILYFSTKNLKLSVFFGKVLGVALISYIAWLISIANITAFSQKLTIIVLLLLSLIAIALAMFHRHRAFSFNTIKVFAISELMFVISFFFMLFYLTTNFGKLIKPEDFTNFAIFNSLVKFEHMPPIDIWFSGKSINYYYFGHLTLATLTKLTSTIPEVAFNLGFAGIFAQTVTSVFGLGVLISKKYLTGLLTVLFVVLSGNMYSIILLFANPTGIDLDFSKTTRIVPYTINDMPSYSFFGGGIHAHVMNIPVVIFTICLIFLSLSEKSRNAQYFLGIAFALMYLINSWDFFIYLVFLGIGILIYKRKKQELIGFKYFAIPLLVSIILVLPFLQTFKVPVQGIGLNTNFSGFKAIGLMFGSFALITMFYFFYFKNLKNKTIATTLLTALVLILIGELVFVKDIYFSENTPFYRANTLYKLWYQAWILWGISSAIMVTEILQTHVQSRLHKFKYLFIELVIVMSVIYPSFLILGTFYAGTNSTLEGTSFLSKSQKEGVKFLQSLPSSSVTAEFYGNANDNKSLYTTFSGVPTILGWANHEMGWRNNTQDIEERKKDINLIFFSNDTNEVLNLLKKYNAKYIISEEYDNKVFSQIAKEKVTNNEVKIYEVEY